jgi:hypothetical protein
LAEKKQPKEKKIKYPTAEMVVAINRYILTGKDESGLLSPEQKAKIDKMNANLTPRDPARIDQILDALKTIWKTVPDQRLGQLLLNYAFREADHRDQTSIEMYGQEDTETLEALKKIDAQRRARENDTIEDLHADDMLTSGKPWVKPRQRKKKA